MFFKESFHKLSSFRKKKGGSEMPQETRYIAEHSKWFHRGKNTCAPSSENPLPASDGAPAPMPGGEPTIGARPALLEHDCPALLERIQSLLGISLMLERTPDDSQLRTRLLDGVREFPWILQDQGLSVLSSDSERPNAFTTVVKDSNPGETSIVLPAILRGDAVVMKGIRCVSKTSPVSGLATTSPPSEDGDDHLPPVSDPVPGQAAEPLKENPAFQDDVAPSDSGNAYSAGNQEVFPGNHT